MASLQFDSCKSYGVRLKDDSELKADHVVLCTAAPTAKLLADSAPQRQELRVVAVYVRLTSNQIDRFKESYASICWCNTRCQR